jgi:hypothetical protein
MLNVAIITCIEKKKKTQGKYALSNFLIFQKACKNDESGQTISFPDKLSMLLQELPWHF